MSESFRILNPEQAREVRTAAVARPEVHCWQVDGHRVAYDANSMVAVEVKSDMLWQQLHRLAAHPAEASCMADGLLFTRDAPQFEFAPPLKKRHIVLNVTHACNLACKYCFVARSDDEPMAMDFETAVAAIEQLAPAPLRHIGFFGGEPMLKFDLVQRIVERFAGEGTTWGMTTNATLLGEVEAAFLAEHHFSMIVSIDGPPPVHNANRPSQCGGGSYADTMMGLLGLANAGLRPTLRATCREPVQLLAAAVHLNAAVQDGLGAHVAVEPALCSEGCGCEALRGAPSAWEEAYVELARWMATEARSGRRVGIHHVCQPLRRLRDRAPQPSECGAGKNYFTVAPDGAIHACHRERTAIGHAATGLDERLRQPWLDNRYYARWMCPTCPIRNACGGGCRSESVYREHEIRRPHSGHCEFMRMWFRSALWLLCELTPDELSMLL